MSQSGSLSSDGPERAPHEKGDTTVSPFRRGRARQRLFAVVVFSGWSVSFCTRQLFTSDDEPGRIYKLTLDGKILGTLGKSGHEVKQFNCPQCGSPLNIKNGMLATVYSTLPL